VSTEGNSVRVDAVSDGVLTITPGEVKDFYGVAGGVSAKRDMKEIDRARAMSLISIPGASSGLVEAPQDWLRTSFLHHQWSSLLAGKVGTTMYNLSVPGALANQVRLDEAKREDAARLFWGKGAR
jgi:hypothetical protein